MSFFFSWVWKLKEIDIILTEYWSRRFWKRKHRNIMLLNTEQSCTISQTEKLQCVLDLWQSEQGAQVVKIATHHLHNKRYIFTPLIVLFLLYNSRNSRIWNSATPVFWLVNWTQTHHWQLTLLKLIYLLKHFFMSQHFPFYHLCYWAEAI